MKNITFLFLLIFSLTTMFAQNFQGKAFYTSKTKMDPNFGKTSLQRKQRIIERMKSNMEKNYELDFSSTASLFYEEERLISLVETDVLIYVFYESLSRYFI